MSNDPTFDEDDAKPPLTIDERIAIGRETDRDSDGAIVPFPPRVRGETILRGLRGRDNEFVEKLLFAGYRLKYFDYLSSAGELIQTVLRFDHPADKKEVRPVRYCGSYDGKGRVFQMKWIDDRKALYGLDQLAARPDAPVLVVEGEKAADAAAKIFPDHVVITWMSGAYNVRRTEMLALTGRNLTLWPDNDPPGRSAMRTFAAFAYAAGAASVRWVDVPGEFGLKWDLADDVPVELSDDYPLATLLDTARTVEPSSVAHLTSDGRQVAEQRRLLGHKVGYSKVSIDAVETALSVLNPDMFGNEWRAVARSIFYAFGNDGLDVFDNWSRGSTDGKYRDGEPAKLWAAFKKEPSFRGKSLAWLFRKSAYELRERAKCSDAAVPNVELDKGAVVRATIEELNEDHAVVMRGGKLGVLWEAYDPRYERYTEIYLKKQDFVDRFVDRIELPDDDDRQPKSGGKRLKKGDLWFSSVSRRSYDSVYFAPGTTVPSTMLNLWRGFAVQRSRNPDGWSRLKQHLLDHVAGGDLASYEYLLNWMAFAVQRLDNPIGTALVLIGDKGAGKSIVTELFGRLFGQHAFVTSRMEDVLGRFNDRLEATVLLGLEEAVAPQNRQADGTLKDLITRRDLRLEGKFYGLWDAPNHLRIIVTSNNEHVVRADGSERRYAVFGVTNPHQIDPTARRAYFGLMVEQMETGGLEAMLGELLDRDIRNWNAEVIPDTPALRRQKEMNLVNDPVRAFLFERLSQGDYIVTGAAGQGYGVVAWSESEEVAVSVRALIEEFRAFTQAHGMQFRERQFANHLPRYMPEGFKSATVRDTSSLSGGTLRVYPFPPLEVARRRFEEVTGLIINREV